MGYEVHIARRANWHDQSGAEVALEEWIALVHRDPEMRLDGFAEAVTHDGGLRVESPGLAVWLSYSQDGIDGGHAWFDWHRGEVVVKSPDAEIVRKMVSIARILSARVQGDDEEFYDARGRVIRPKAWWRF